MGMNVDMFRRRLAVVCARVSHADGIRKALRAKDRLAHATVIVNSKEMRGYVAAAAAVCLRH